MVLFITPIFICFVLSCFAKDPSHPSPQRINPAHCRSMERRPAYTIRDPAADPSPSRRGVLSWLFGSMSSSIGTIQSRIRPASAHGDYGNEPVLAEPLPGICDRNLSGTESTENPFNPPLAPAFVSPCNATARPPTLTPSYATEPDYTITWSNVDLHKTTIAQLERYKKICTESMAIPTLTTRGRGLCATIMQLCDKQRGIIDRYVSACNVAFRNEVVRMVHQQDVNDQIERITNRTQSEQTSVTTDTKKRIQYAEIETRMMQSVLPASSAVMVFTTDSSIRASMSSISNFVEMLFAELAKMTAHT